MKNHKGSQTNTKATKNHKQPNKHKTPENTCKHSKTLKNTYKLLKTLENTVKTKIQDLKNHAS